MLVDGRQVPDGTTIETDVCVIGAGAAGITLALAFGGESFRVCLVESGGFEYDPATQALYEGESVGKVHSTLSASRLRYFGGTTNHWGGWCRPLDATDFTARSWIPHSGWPIEPQELDVHLRRAHEIIRLGPYDYSASGWEGRGYGSRMELGDEHFETVMFQMRGTRFGIFYKDDVTGLPNVHTFTYSNVVDIEVPSGNRVVTGARVKTLEGNEFSVSARIYILACGAIENARILLASNGKHPNGLGNENDLVGRFFMDHPALEGAAELLPLRHFDPGLYVPHMSGELQAFGALTPALATLDAERLLGFALTFIPRFPTYLDEAARSEGWESLRTLGKRLVFGQSGDGLAGHLWRVLRSLDRVANAAYGRLAASRVIRRYGVVYHGEQEPNPDSRVTLDSERDALGVPRAKLDWRLTDQDLRTVRRGLEILGNDLGRTGLGRLQIPDVVQGYAWQDAVTGSFHHMGTTRMADDARAGVVDRTCRVHSLGNLYIAGSSVFPTCGYANPTLTLTALALRLAETVKAAL